MARTLGSEDSSGASGVGLLLVRAPVLLGEWLRARGAQGFPLIFVGVLVLWFTGDHSLNSIWLSRWGFCFLTFGAWLAYRMTLRSWSLGLLVAAVFLSAFPQLYWAPTHEGLPLEVKLALRESVACSVVAFVLGVWFFSECSKGTLWSLQRAFAWAGLGVSLMVLLVSDLFDVSQWVPLFDNPSMAGSFIAVTLFLGLPKPWALLSWMSGLSAMWMMGATTPFLAVLAGFFVSSARWEPVLSLVTGWVVAVFLGAKSYLSPVHGTWFSSSGRFEMWGAAFQEWWSRDLLTLIFGWGPGATRVWYPLIQVQNGKAVNEGVWHLWLHQDWLQILFELGALGAVAVLAVAVTWTLKAWRDSTLLGAGAAFAAVMAFNFPLHFPQTALLGAVILARGFRSELARPSVPRARASGGKLGIF